MINTVSINNADWKTANINGFSYHHLIDERGGTLKYIRIEPNATNPKHLHPDKTEYAVVLGGVCKITLADKTFSASADDVVVFPNAVNHALANNTNIEVVMLARAITLNK